MLINYIQENLQLLGKPSVQNYVKEVLEDVTERSNLKLTCDKDVRHCLIKLAVLIENKAVDVDKLFEFVVTLDNKKPKHEIDFANKMK